MERYKSQLTEQSLNEMAFSNDLIKSFTYVFNLFRNDTELAKVVANSILKAFENSNYDSEKIERFTRFLYKHINTQLYN
jgi:hypothetical protein